MELIQQIATAMEEFDKDDGVRAVVLCAQGKSFCAGANFNDPNRQEQPANVGGKPTNHLYQEAVRLLRTKKPIVAAVHGAAIGGGLGVACAADFRVTCPEARFAANFTKLGFHPGFGLTVLLTELVGKNQAELLFYTGRRIGGEEATRIGLASVCVPQDQVRAEVDEARSRDRRKRAAGDHLDAQDHARRPRRPRQGRDRPRAEGADLAARDGRLQGRRQGHRRAPRRQLEGAVDRHSGARARRATRNLDVHTLSPIISGFRIAALRRPE